MYTDRQVRTPGSTPTLGAAGTVITDPVFGARIARATDGAFITDLGTTNRSFGSPASGYQQAWNADGTKFAALAGDGNVYIVSFNRTTMATSRFGGASHVWGVVTWDHADANTLYGYAFAANGHTVAKMDASTTALTATTVVDLDTVTAGLNTPDPTYMSALVEGNGNLIVTYGGTSQDLNKYCLWYPIATPSAKKVLDATTRNGMDAFNSHFSLHSAQVDKSGRYVSLIPAVLSSAPYATYIWDTTLDTVTPITSHSGGHEVLGYGKRINSDTLTTFDATQYILTPDLGSPMSGRIELINPLGSPQETFAADHTSWNNADPAIAKPVVAGIYRVYDGPNNVPPNKNDTPWRAWDGEIITVETDGSGVVKRHCHHRSPVYPEVGVGAFDFPYTPRPNIDKQGQFAIFTSNWDKTLGDDTVEGNKRRDVFVVDLTSAAGRRSHRHRTRLR